MDLCNARSPFSEEDICAEPVGHSGGHSTAIDANGMATGWGHSLPADSVEVRCPALCGMTVSTTPRQMTGILHNPDGSHTLTDAAGSEFTIGAVVVVEPHPIETVRSFEIVA